MELSKSKLSTSDHTSSLPWKITSHSNTITVPLGNTPNTPNIAVDIDIQNRVWPYAP
jgi:hypothetical protein